MACDRLTDGFSELEKVTADSENNRPLLRPGRPPWRQLIKALSTVQAELRRVRDIPRLPRRALVAIDTMSPHHPERFATWDSAADELAHIDEATHRVLLQRRLPRRARDRLTAMLKDAVEPMLRSAGRVPVAYDFRGWPTPRQR